MTITFEALQQLVQENTLILSNKKLNDEDIKNVCAFLRTHPSITSLDVRWNKISNEGAKALAATRLSSLNAGSNYIGVEGAKALAENTSFTSLNVGSNYLGDEGVIALAMHTYITSLNVSSNGIGDKGAKALSENANLTSLDIGWNQVSDKGIQMLENNKRFVLLNERGNEPHLEKSTSTWLKGFMTKIASLRRCPEENCC